MGGQRVEPVLASSQRPGRGGRTQFPALERRLRKQNLKCSTWESMDRPNLTKAKGLLGGPMCEGGAACKGPEGQEVEPEAAPQPRSRGRGLTL